MLESNPSAEVGGMTEGQDSIGSAFPFLLPLLIPPNALNSGGLGAEPPISIGSS